MLQPSSAAPLGGGPEGPRPAAARRRRSADPSRPPGAPAALTAGVFSAGVCVQVSLQIRAQAVKVKRSGVVSGGGEPCFSHRMTFRLRPRRLDRACLRFELLQPGGVGSGERSRPRTHTSASTRSKSGVYSVTVASKRHFIHSLWLLAVALFSVLLSEHPATLGVLVLGPFMYARGPQLQHWTDMLSTPQDAVKRWHVLGRPS